ncbi:preprotein translocase subunit SecG [Candidatus Dojkabacteria bacterium]|uniref:Protein-export membrane protein SecG n=1 Tax=Candidatus Dojkabacteria bacterium TaxID=2099670 RepID=A0A955IB01_9BACT|nr:preprotein translocase subunit SecG [Candidatus Dojkabacteria bacterium]
MNVDAIIKYLLAVDAFLIIIFVLLQTRSGGLGAVFGGSSGGDLYKSRRGFEAFLYNGTIFLGIIFAILSLGIAVISA